MNYLSLHFVDPTIPGISGSDLTEKAVRAVQSTIARPDGARRAARWDVAIRKALAHLDTHRLRDLGIDRGAA